MIGSSKVAGVVRSYGEYEGRTEVVYDLGEESIELNGVFETTNPIRLVFASKGGISIKNASFRGFTTVTACVSGYDVARDHCNYEVSKEGGGASAKRGGCSSIRWLRWIDLG